MFTVSFPPSLAASSLLAFAAFPISPLPVFPGLTPAARPGVFPRRALGSATVGAAAFGGTLATVPLPPPAVLLRSPARDEVGYQGGDHDRYHDDY